MLCSITSAFLSLSYSAVDVSQMCFYFGVM